MSTLWYKFRYIDINGSRKTETIKARSIQVAKQYIISKKYHLISIRHLYFYEHYFRQFKNHRLVKLIVRPKLTKSELYWFTKELFSFLDSGLPLLDSLYALKGFSSSSRYQKIIHDIIYNVENGKSLSDIMSDYPSTFPKYYIIAIRSGESVGRLPESLKSNADILNWVSKNNVRLIQATIFPLISLIMIIASFLLSRFEYWFPTS